MLWDEASPYQHGNTRLTKELIDFFFEREVRYLSTFQNRSWAPKLIEIDSLNRKVFIEFNNETLNHIIFTNRDLDKICPDWKEQIFNILQDIVTSGYYKMALYPHCFFIDKNNQIKTIDFYACLAQSERYLERNKIAGMIGEQSVHRFDEATNNGMIDFDFFFKQTISKHLSTAWPDNPFVDYHKRIYG
jgi:hypothetical protein